MICVDIDMLTPCLKDSDIGELVETEVLKVKNNPGPISINQIPIVKIDYKGLIAYAKAKNMRPGDLSDEEKNKFFLDGHNMEWVRANAGYKITV